MGGRRPGGAAVSALSGTHWLCSPPGKTRRPTPLADGGPASLGSRCLRRRIRSQPACTLTSLVSPCRLSQRPWLPGLRYVACTSCIRLSSLDCGNERQWQVSPAPPSARVRGRGSASQRLRAGVPAPWLPHAARTRGVPGAGCPTVRTGARARLPGAGRTVGTGVVPGGRTRAWGWARLRALDSPTRFVLTARPREARRIRGTEKLSEWLGVAQRGTRSRDSGPGHQVPESGADLQDSQ